MKIKIDTRFPDIPFCKNVDWLKAQVVKEEHVVWCSEHWANIEDKFESHAGGNGPSDYLDWSYHFSPKGLIISYALFHMIEWCEMFLEFDVEDSCTMDVLWSKSEIEQILQKQTQLKLF